MVELDGAESVAYDEMEVAMLVGVDVPLFVSVDSGRGVTGGDRYAWVRDPAAEATSTTVVTIWGAEGAAGRAAVAAAGRAGAVRSEGNEGAEGADGSETVIVGRPELSTSTPTVIVSSTTTVKSVVVVVVVVVAAACRRMSRGRVSLTLLSARCARPSRRLTVSMADKASERGSYHEFPLLSSHNASVARSGSTTRRRLARWPMLRAAM